jgi:hypothetical protein
MASQVKTVLAAILLIVGVINQLLAAPVGFNQEVDTAKVSVPLTGT